MRIKILEKNETKQHDKIRDERDALNEQLSHQKSDNELLAKIRELLNIESPQHVTKKRDVENNTTTRIGSNQVSDFNILWYVYEWID